MSNRSPYARDRPMSAVLERVLRLVTKRTMPTPKRQQIALASERVAPLIPCLEDGVCASSQKDLSSWKSHLATISKRLEWLDDSMLVTARKRLKFLPVNAEGKPAASGAVLLADGSPLVSTPGALMDFECVMTTTQQDREGDVLEAAGAELDERMPLLWQHLPNFPIGRYVRTTFRDELHVRIQNAISDTLLGRDAAVLVEFEALRISHGFVPIEVEEIPAGPGDPAEAVSFHVIRYKVLESSLVSIPANEGATITAFSRGKLFHPVVKSYAESLRRKLPKQVTSGFASDAHAEEANVKPKKRTCPTVKKLTKGSASKAQCPNNSGITLSDDYGCPEMYQSAKSGKDKCSGCSKPIAPGYRSLAQLHKPNAASKMLKRERWNKKLSKAFDVASAPLEPDSLAFDWISRYLGVPVKHVYTVSTVVGGARMGNWLSALKSVMGTRWNVEDTRNIGHNGTEMPPQDEVVQLNSKMSDTFLIQGYQFNRPADKSLPLLVVRFAPSWNGEEVQFFSARENSEHVRKLLEDTYAHAAEHNFLKGEAFSLSGEFLPKTTEQWEDLFLEPTNEKAIKRVVERVNSKGKSIKNHGMIMSGPPGTGKTLSGRIFRNQANATFIWVSARDFYYTGSFGGLAMAWDLAKELAPAIVFIEDVDNWLSEHTVDYIKTEMDGIGRSNGIVTVLTSNFPERMPEALIDRPGRFHDVLHFGHPGKTVRAAMLAKWLPGTDLDVVAAAVEQTEGMSGAHIYHLCQFAIDLEETDALGRKDSIVAAIRKTTEQRELIDGIQLEGSRYKPHKSFTPKGPPMAKRTPGKKSCGGTCGGACGKKSHGTPLSSIPSTRTITIGNLVMKDDGAPPPSADQPSAAGTSACPNNPQITLTEQDACPEALASIGEGQAACRSCGAEIKMEMGPEQPAAQETSADADAQDIKAKCPECKGSGKCWECKGSGKGDEADGSCGDCGTSGVCQFCGGSGGSQNASAKATAQCPHCAGVGQVAAEDGSMMACPQCAGQGVIEVAGEKRTDYMCDCRDCGNAWDSNGSKPTKCPKCGSTNITAGEYGIPGPGKSGRRLITKTLSKAKKSLLSRATRLIQAALDHDEMKDAEVVRALLMTAGASVKEALGEDEEKPKEGEEKNGQLCTACRGHGECKNCDGDGFEDAPNGRVTECTACHGTGVCQQCDGVGMKGTQPGDPNPDTEDADSEKPNPGMEKAALTLTAKLMAGRRVSWDTLHALKDAVGEAIQAQDITAATESVKEEEEDEREEKTIVSAKCPNCGRVSRFMLEDDDVECPGCDQEFHVGEHVVGKGMHGIENVPADEGGTCSLCGKPYRMGDKITCTSDDQMDNYAHAECARQQGIKAGGDQLGQDSGSGLISATCPHCGVSGRYDPDYSDAECWSCDRRFPLKKASTVTRDASEEEEAVPPAVEGEKRLTVRCDGCKGAYTVDPNDFVDARCPHCGDEAWTIIADASPDAQADLSTRLCKSCYGAGKVILGGKPTSCETCSGTGYVKEGEAETPEEKAWELTCENCGWKGSKQELDDDGDCPSCGASDFEDHTKTADGDDSQDICPVCKGSGRDGGKECVRCQGDGMVPAGQGIDDGSSGRYDNPPSGRSVVTV